MTSSPDIFAVGIEDELLKPLTSDACLLGASSVATYGESCLEYYPDHAESCSRRSGQCGEDLDDRFVAADSTGQRNTLIEFISWCLEVQCFPRPCVQLSSYPS